MLIEILGKTGLRLKAAKCEVVALDCEDVPVMIGEEQVKAVQNFNYLGNVVTDIQINIGEGFDGDQKRMVQR